MKKFVVGDHQQQEDGDGVLSIVVTLVILEVSGNKGLVGTELRGTFDPNFL